MTKNWQPTIELWQVKNPHRYLSDGWLTINEIGEREVLEICRERYSYASNAEIHVNEEMDFELLCVATAIWRGYLREVASSIADSFDDSLKLLPEMEGASERNIYPARWCIDNTDPDIDEVYRDVYLFFMADTDGDLRSWY